MKVRIDRERGPNDAPRWYFSTTGEPPAPTKPRYASYPETKAAVLAAGHDIDNAGWKHQLLMWNWQNHSLDGFPDWEIEQGERTPAFAKLTHTRGDGEIESHALAAAWDDIAEADFYQRDVTDDSIPFVNKGETYWSLWWFATVAERDRFVRWSKERTDG